jgi:phage FluMu protein Com
MERDDPCGLRCLCGSLLARVVDDHVELKCKRCKRMMLVPLSGAAQARSAEISSQHHAE